MKLIEFAVRKFRGVELAELKPDGKPVVVEGENEVGKTSLLRAVAWCLTGKDKGDPLRKQFESGEVELGIGEAGKSPLWTIRRRMRKGKPDILDLEDAAGDKQTHVGQGKERRTAVAFIKDLLKAGIAWNPWRFDQLSADDRLDMLREAAGVDTSEVDGEYRTLYAQRTEQSRRRDRAKVLAAEAVFYPEAPGEPVDVAALTEKVEAYHKRVAEAEAWCKTANAARDGIEITIEQIKSLEAQLLQAKKELSERQEQYAEIECEEPQDPDTDAYEAARQEIASAEETNQQVRTNEEKSRLLEEAKAEKRAYDNMTNALSALESRRKEMLEQSNMSVPGLEVTGDQILFEGTPYDDHCHSKRMKAAMLIGGAMNAGLRIAIVDNSEGMDKKRLAEFFKAAEEVNVQPIVARVVDDQDSLNLRIWEKKDD